MSEWVLPLAVGAATGVLSGFGVGEAPSCWSI